MRILIYGAGVIGSNLAAELYSSGKDVTILARGNWADTLEKNGLNIAPVFSFRKRKYSIPVIRKLRCEDVYDAIFVVMRYTQLDGIIPVLAENTSRNIILIGNNLSAGKYVEKPKSKNVLFGFNLAGGHREKDRVVSVSLRKITIGPLKEGHLNEELMMKIFNGTRMKVTYQPNMEDWLLCHAALVVPIAFACYYCDGNLKKIRNNKVYLNRIIDANIEGFEAIGTAGHEILPQSDVNFRSKKHRRLWYFLYKAMCSTVLGKICASDHALNAVEEMSALNEGLERFYDAHQSAYSSYQQLETDAGEYLRGEDASCWNMSTRSPKYKALPGRL